MKIWESIKNFVMYRMFGRITREIRYRRRLREMKKRDPFIY